MGKRAPPLVWKLARLDDMISAGVGYGPVNYAVAKGSEEFYLGRGVTHPVYLPMHLAQASISRGGPRRARDHLPRHEPFPGAAGADRRVEVFEEGPDTLLEGRRLDRA